MHKPHDEVKVIPRNGEENNEENLPKPQEVWLRECLTMTLSQLGCSDLLPKFIDSGVELEEWLEADPVLVDKWLTELGIQKIGGRAKFVKIMKEVREKKIKERCRACPTDRIYLPEYDKEVKFNGTVGWPSADAYRRIIESAETEEAMSDIQDTNGTIGVVVSLLLTMVFLQNGRDVTVSKECVWGKNAELGQDTLTCLLCITAVICVCVILFTTRVYFAASLLPKNSGRLAMAIIGGDFGLNYALYAFFTFAICFGASIGVWISLVFDSVTATVMLIVCGLLIFLQLMMCGFNQFWPGGTVDMRFEEAIRFLFPGVSI
jgi:hypothetical protein